MRSIRACLVLSVVAGAALALAPSGARAGWGRPVAVGYYGPAYYYTPTYYPPAYYYAPVVYRSSYVSPVVYSSYYVTPAYQYPAYTSYYVAPAYYYGGWHGPHSVWGAYSRPAYYGAWDSTYGVWGAYSR